MLAVLAMLAPKRALRVAAGGCAPLLPCVARRGRCDVRPGRESRRVSRTGRRIGERCRHDRRVTLGIERHRGDRRPVPGAPAPACRRLSACRLIKFVARGEDCVVRPGVTFGGCDVADRAVPVLVVVPMHEARGPAACRLEIGEALGRELRAVLGGAEQGLGEGVVVTDPRARIGGRDAQPVAASPAPWWP